MGWVVLSSLAFLVAAAPPPAQPTTAARPATSSCGPLATAADWATHFRSLKGRWAIADQATSLALPDGRFLWLFGDTVQGQLVRQGTALEVQRWRMPHNSVVLTRGSTCAPIQIHTGRDGTSLLPDARGDAHWPMSAVLDRGKLFVFASRVRLTGDEFFGIGTRLARLRLAAGAGTPTFAGWRRTPATGVDELSGVQWGAAVAQRGRFNYVYGTQRSAGDLVFGRSLHVARVPQGRLARPSAWRYWNGAQWVRGQQHARPIRQAVGGVSTTLSVHHVRGRWVAVTKADGFLGDRVVMLDAPKPYGPWRETTLRSTDTATALTNGDLTYTAMAHPEAKLASGRLLVTLSRNNLDSAKTLVDVERGRPLFFEAAWPDRP
jgi:hypothetical protein